ncbi:MAG TPA: thioredoxin-like domain-containing protein [Vicinamibacterales bacterium]|nr:thioredoxin-like domain-containing protein [Vicinamibacterales bacterium]
MTDAAVRIHAPEFPAGLDWFNVAAPLSLKTLRGKVVLLDFWTYGCINCLHVLPDLKRLQEKYRAELVVIGVHSAKFTNERQGENLRRILVRYDVDHPVVNDVRFEVWRSYGARAWPTQVLIDPEGYVVATASGEGNAPAFDRAIAAVRDVFEEQGKLDRTPLALSPERERLAMGTLAFPGKVLADEASGRLFVADSNHHRVLVTTLEGRITRVVGDGAFGWTDGAFDRARFYRPQGLALDGDTLYVADTENHVVRAVDLRAERVTTLAGSGRQAAWGGAGGAARETSLSSPWDLQVASRLLFVAMAGLHQIWVVDLDRHLAMPYAGSGREARVDGPADEAAFAQPSGLALSGSTMFVADSESNLIRAIALPPANDVRTLAGGDLFEFGDRDGAGDDVRLQHPLGVAWTRGRVFIADTYNHKIKALDPKTRRVTTFVGTGEPGATDGPAAGARFYEPGGLAATSASLYIADTNNHAIRRVALADGRVETLEVK